MQAYDWLLLLWPESTLLLLPFVGLQAPFSQLLNPCSIHRSTSIVVTRSLGGQQLSRHLDKQRKAVYQAGRGAPKVRIVGCIHKL